MPCKNHPDVIENLVKCSRCGAEFCRDCVVELQGNFYCAACKAEQVRDIESGTDATQIDLASIGRRFAALWLDNLILSVPLVALLLAMVFGMGYSDLFADPDQAFVLPVLVTVVFGAVALVYEGLFLQSRGQTLGKMALKIKVVTPEGNDISVGQAWGRAFVRVIFSCIPNLGWLALINYLPALFGKEKKCIHDSAAKTRVVNWRP